MKNTFFRGEQEESGIVLSLREIQSSRSEKKAGTYVFAWTMYPLDRNCGARKGGTTANVTTYSLLLWTAFIS